MSGGIVVVAASFIADVTAMAKEGPFDINKIPTFKVIELKF